MNREDIKSLANGLRNALSTMKVLAGDERNRQLLAKLFAPEAGAKVKDLSDALKGYKATDPESIKAVNEVVSQVLGEKVELSPSEIDTLDAFFWEEQYLPIKPVDGDPAMHTFYEAVFKDETGLAKLKDLQNALGTYWTGGDPTGEEMVARLKTIANTVSWDSRHLAALVQFLIFDARMKQFKPFDISGSIW
jgi:hypothetical protein